MIKGKKKKLLEDIITYYIEVTGNTYIDYIEECEEGYTEEYSEWLAIELQKLLDREGITITDLKSNKDLLQKIVDSDKSRGEGEFYTPEVWCREGREYLKEILGDKWGEAYIWDVSCGAGNLLRSIDYDESKLFMSTLLEEDVEMVKKEFPNREVFKCDFLDGIDWGEGNEMFTDRLPSKLQEVLREDKPLVIYMNPPYNNIKVEDTDIGVLMKSNGVSLGGLDIANQFMYRLVTIKRYFNLKNIYIGVFSPITMFYSRQTQTFFKDFKREFQFVDGSCLDAKAFGGTSDAIDWIIGYTCWRVRGEGEKESEMIVSAKEIEKGGKILETIGSKKIEQSDTLEEWEKAKDITSHIYLPEMTSFGVLKGTIVKVAENNIGSMMTHNLAKKAMQRVAVSTLPIPDSISITEENFLRCVASYSSKRGYALDSNAYNNCQFLKKPNIQVKGYEDWLADGVVLFLFDRKSYIGTYDNLDVDGDVFEVRNKLFPLSKEEVENLVSDEKLIADLNSFEMRNKYIVNLLRDIEHRLGKEAKELYDFSINLIKKSLEGTYRKDNNYNRWTHRVDVGLMQIKELEGVYTKDIDKEHIRLTRELRKRLLRGIYTYEIFEDVYRDKYNKKGDR